MYIADDDEFLQIKDSPMVSMEMLTCKVEPMMQKNQIKTNGNIIQKTEIRNPIVLKPVTGATENIRSHIKIGNNIFAIVQKGTKNTQLSTIDSSNKILTQLNELSNSNTILKISKPEEVKKTSFCSRNDDHDYVEEDEPFESMGVSKVNYK